MKGLNESRLLSLLAQKTGAGAKGGWRIKVPHWGFTANITVHLLHLYTHLIFTYTPRLASCRHSTSPNPSIAMRERTSCERPLALRSTVLRPTVPTETQQPTKGSMSRQSLVTGSKLVSSTHRERSEVSFRLLIEYRPADPQISSTRPPWPFQSHPPLTS